MIKLFSERLNHLLDKVDCPHAINARMACVASKFDVSPQTARKWLRGKALPNPLILCEMARRFSISLDWLLSGVPATQTSKTVDIPIYSVETSAPASMALRKTGTSWYEHGCNECTSNRAWIVNWIPMANPEFGLGDQILIDMDDLRILEDRIFLIRCGSMLMWRTLVLSMDGQFAACVTTSTGRYSSELLDPDNIDFNTTGEINATPPRETPFILGRAVAMYKEFAFHHCSLDGTNCIPGSSAIPMRFDQALLKRK